MRTIDRSQVTDMVELAGSSVSISIMVASFLITGEGQLGLEPLRAFESNGALDLKFSRAELMSEP